MSGDYGVIVSDPPWSYANGGVRGSALNHYPTMTDAQIAALSVDTLARADCVLLMWATWPKLDVAMATIAAWGFKYTTAIPWIKVNSVSDDLLSNELRVTVPYGVGFWARGVSEPLLIAKRGKVTPTTGDYIGLLSPNLYHSRKPDSVYALAEHYAGPYLEMFARRPRAGWDCWSNEIQSTSGVEAALVEPQQETTP